MTHYVDSWPIARATHFCDMCHRQVGPGEKYRRSAGMDGSTAWTWKECAHCAAFVTFAYASRYWDDGYDETLLGDFTPDNIAEARVLVQWRRKWRRSDGVLYPVPEVARREDRYGFGWPVGIAPGAAA